MTATRTLYAASALGFGIPTDAGSHWHYPVNAAGAPNGSFAYNDDPTLGGQQQLGLTGYNPQAAILADTGGQVPFSVDYLQVQLTYSIDDAASNFTDVSVLLLHADGTVFAREPMYLLNAGDGHTIQGNINFTGHAGYGNAPLSWDDLAGLQLAVQITRSGAAGPDTFRVDAVGLVVVYTLTFPDDPRSDASAASTGVTLRAYDRAGNRVGVLPWSSLTRTIVRNTGGALTAAVPRSLLNWEALPDECYLRVAVNGVESRDWYLLDDDGDDDADPGGPVRPVTLAAAGVAEILSWGIVYSWQYDPANPATLLNLDPTHGFADKTPGYILNELLTAAKARGCFPHLTWSFTADVDSAGRGWNTTYSKTYDLGADLLTVLTGMSTDGWVDWEMTGFRLDVYIADTELAVDRPDLVLRLGKGVTQAPRQRTRKSARSTILANGANGPNDTQGPIVEVSDPAAVARWGRREGYEGRSSISDYGTLTAATQVSLSRQTTASETLTLELDPFAMPAETPALPRPGGYLRYDQRRLDAATLEPMRVQSIAWDYGPDTPKVSVELADLWVDADVKRGRQLDAILNGSSANDRVPTAAAGDDGLAPAQVHGVAVTSTAYVDTKGQTFAQATASWVQITTNADGSVIGDLAGYELEWQQPDVIPGSQLIPTPGVVTLWQWSSIVAGALLWVRVRATDRFGNAGAWSDWAIVPAGDDVTPPPQPSTPTVDNYLGLLRTAWDGTFTGGVGRPSDLRRVEVHVGTVAGFAIDTRPIDAGGTWAGNLIAAGAVFTDVPYGQTRYAKLVAVDTTGNRSVVSDEVSGTTGQVVSADVFDGAVGSAKLADLAVTTAKINDLAVNTAKVGELDVGKLVTGTMTAQIIMGGTISTNTNPDTTGGVQINGTGIYAWDPTGRQTVAIDTAGNATLTGTYRTATGGRRIEILAAGSTGAINFYSSTGALQSITSGSTWGTSSGTVEALRLNGGSTSFLSITADNRVSVYADLTTFTYKTSWEVWSGADPATKGGLRRMFINDSEIGFQFPGLLGGVYIDGGSAEISPILKFMDGNNVGSGLRMVAPVASSSTNPMRMEVIAQDASAYLPIWASNVSMTSDAALKTNIETAPSGMLAKVRATPVRRYERIQKPLRDRHGKLARKVKPPQPGPELGFVAQEAPPELVGGGEGGAPLVIRLYDTVAMHWAATQEQADLHDTLAGQVEELAAAVAALTGGTTT